MRRMRVSWNWLELVGIGMNGMILSSLASFAEKGKTTDEKARSSESNIHTITITFQVNCQSCRSQVECVAKE